MECNKDEARRALDFAEKKLSKSDYNGAKKLVNRAQNLYPDLDGLKQASKIIDVYIAASNGDGEPDWYGILGIDPLDNDEIVRTKYRKLLLFVHPDKSRCKDARGAHDLVKKVYSLLSDKAKRIAYDRKRKSKQRKSDDSSTSENSKAKTKEEAQEKMKRWFEESRKKLDAAIAAASARGNPSEAPTTTRGYGYDRKRKSREVKQEKSNVSSSSDSTKAPPKEDQERVKRWLKESREKLDAAVAAASARANPSEAPTTRGFGFDRKRKYKEVKQEKSNASSSSKAPPKEGQERWKRWFEESRENLASAIAAASARGNPNEAERVYKKPMTTTGDAMSSLEAQRLLRIRLKVVTETVLLKLIGFLRCQWHTGNKK